MMRWVRLPQHPCPKPFTFFLFGSIINGSVNFLFLPDRRISGVDWGGSKLNMSKMVSIGSSSLCGTLLECFKRRFCNLFWCLLCMYLGPSTMYTISTILFLIIPRSQKYVLFFKVNFFSRVEPFFVLMWSFVAYFVSGVAYRRRILIFWQTSSRLVRLPVVYWDWVWICIPVEITVVPCPSGYLLLFWVLALTCLQNVQPSRLILGDFAVWLCALFGRFRRAPWIRLMWIGFRCRWPHNLLHRTAQTFHVETQ